MSSKTILEIQAISHPPIHHLSFKWTCGIHWICGDEGSGKTTLLKLLANELKPKEGFISNPEASVFWRSIHVVKKFLNDMSEHPHRAWIVADYSAPTDIALTTVLNLDHNDS